MNKTMTVKAVCHDISGILREKEKKDE